MKGLRLLGAGALLLAGGVAYADPCKITIDSNDMMQFSAHELTVPAACTDVEVTLRHSGKLPAKVMGHDWVLAKDSDVSGIVNAGLAAGASRGYLPENDKRIIAATKVVGGGESTTVKFSTAALEPPRACGHSRSRREESNHAVAAGVGEVGLKHCDHRIRAPRLRHRVAVDVKLHRRGRDSGRVPFRPGIRAPRCSWCKRRGPRRSRPESARRACERALASGPPRRSARH